MGLWSLESDVLSKTIIMCVLKFRKKDYTLKTIIDVASGCMQHS